MKIILSLLLSLFSLCVSAQDPFFYIFLCFGQSNMVGQGVITDVDKKPDDGFLSLSTVDGPDGRKVGQWRVAVPPLCRAETGMSLVDYFGRTMRLNLHGKVRIGVVYVAVDGCAIDLFDKDTSKQYIDSIKADWMRNEVAAYGNDPYGRLVEIARLAQKEGVIRGILLHQGETDAYNDRWLQKVKKIYGDLMTDLNLNPKKVPLVAGEVVNEDQHGICSGANTIIDRLPEVLPNAYVVSSRGCEAGPDKLHFTSKGYELLGTRYALKMLQTMGFEISDGESTVETIATTGHIEPIDVDGQLDDKGIYHATATMPIQRIDYVSYSGKVLSSIDAKGATTIDVNTRLYPDEKRLVIVFYAENRSSTSIEITR